MKNKLFYLILMFLLIFSACKKEEEYGYMKQGNTVSTISKLTMFDTPAKISVSNPSVKEIELVGNVVMLTPTKLSVTDGKADFGLKPADFGAYWAVDSSASFTVTTDFGDYKSVSNLGIKIVSAFKKIDFTPTIEAGARTDSGMIEVYAKALNAGVFDFEISRNVNGGAESVVFSSPGVSEKAKFEDLAIIGADFELGDTLNYTIKATNGTYTEMKKVVIAVVAKQFRKPMQAKLTASADSLKFAKGVYMSFKPTAGTDYERGFASNEMEFVKITPDTKGFTEFKDFTECVTFMKTATLVTSVDNVLIGDAFAYTYTAGDKKYYGYFVVTGVTEDGFGGGLDGFSFYYRDNYVEE